jgi:DNA-binding NarL/FixJ family response regulator
MEGYAMTASASHVDSLTRVIIVDDHPILREGMKNIIDESDDFVVCGEAENIAMALRIIGESNHSFALIDIGLGSESGFDLIKYICNRFGKDIQMLVFSGYDEAEYAQQALRLGAQGYIMKQETCKSLLEAMRKVRDGGIWVSEQIKEKLLLGIAGSRAPNASESLNELSARELEVLRMTGEGLGTKEIATRRRLSAKTVETYYARIKEKLKLNNSRELLHFAITRFHNDRQLSLPPNKRPKQNRNAAARH